MYNAKSGVDRARGKWKWVPSRVGELGFRGSVMNDWGWRNITGRASRDVRKVSCRGT